MAEFTLDDFTTQLRQEMYIRFPYEWQGYHLEKHKNTPEHIRDIAFMNNPVSVNINTRTFDIGGYMAESKYPYYHILQDAPVIRKRDKGTDKSKGNQGKIYKNNVGLRDYNKISFNGKTYSREYSKNVRGTRKNVITNASHWEYKNSLDGDRGKWVFENESSRQYANRHYQYIDKMLDNIAPILAMRYGARLKRKQTTSLEYDYEMSQEIDKEDEMIERMLMSWE